jgi:hypothetical protein
LYLLAAVCLLSVALVPANVVLAQRPEPPEPPVAELEGFDGPPAIDMENLPATVEKAAALQESLTPEQHASVRQVLDKYQPEMQAIMEAYMAVPKPEAGDEPQRVDEELSARMTGVLQDIDAEMAVVLDAEQLALYRAVMQPTLEGVAPESADEGAVPQGSYTSNCEYGAYYAAWTSYYGYYGYVYAYYNYYYNGTTYGYYAYVYGYYGFVYGDLALDYSAPTYVQGYYFGMWTSSYTYNAWYYAYYAEVYTYYSMYYAYYDYYDTGHSLAYYTYYFEYYATYGADLAEYYLYYCDYYCSL